MFEKLLGKLLAPSMTNARRSSDPARWEAALLERIKEMSPSDPQIAPKVCGKELAARLLEQLKTERGVHVESLMCAAGALAGYSCQATVRAKNKTQGLDELSSLSIATTDDGRQFLFGDLLNRYLAESDMSVWSIAAGGAEACGCAKRLDLDGIFIHVANNIGTPQFGIPRLPEGHPVHEQPQAYVTRLWPIMFPMVERLCPEPDHWPMAFGIAIQDLQFQTKGVLDPCIALTVLMESAIPMSKVLQSEV